MDATTARSRTVEPARLLEPHRYPHPVERVELIETHISRVFLAGPFAYKVKKPVTLGFLDFGTLEARRRLCEEELRLNRRTAPEIYLDVVAITGTPENPRISGDGEALEYALRMRRFPQDALAEHMALRGAFHAEHADAVAASVAQLHARAAVAPYASSYGSPESVCRQALDNFDEMLPLTAGERDRRQLEELRRWTLHRGEELHERLDERRRGGFVRECHGDLHLRNIVFLERGAVPFDCIEFDPALRWIDVISEVAFVVMDLLEHGLRGLAWRLLNAYLECTGDYEGVAVLRYYLVYRAMVRAKVGLLRSCQGAPHEHGVEWPEYVALAQRIARAERPAIVLMHGLSGSGKTAVSQALMERLGAIRVRSDVERKRMHGISPLGRSGSDIAAGIYAPSVSREVYERLARLAYGMVTAGYTAIVDAAFLERSERGAFRNLAHRLDAPIFIAACVAPEAELRDRVLARGVHGHDASEAGVAVLERQLMMMERLEPDELVRAEMFHTGGPGSLQAPIDRLAGRIDRAGTAAHALVLRRV
jgi:uncharacterized protein